MYPQTFDWLVELPICRLWWVNFCRLRWDFSFKRAPLRGYRQTIHADHLTFHARCKMDRRPRISPASAYDWLIALPFLDEACEMISTFKFTCEGASMMWIRDPHEEEAAGPEYAHGCHHDGHYLPSLARCLPPSPYNASAWKSIHG